MRIILIAIIILAFAGAIDSGYALQQHYAPPDVSACDYNATVSCTAVNQSEYSEVLGVPVAGVGMAGYLLMALLAGVGLVQRHRTQMMFMLLAVVSLGGFLVAVSLTYIELFVLEAVCPLCVISQALIAAIMVLSWIGALRSRIKRTDTA